MVAQLARGGNPSPHGLEGPDPPPMLNAWLQPRRCRQTSSLLQLDTFLAGEAERGARWGGVFEYLSRRLLNCDMELFLNPVNLSRRRAF